MNLAIIAWSRRPETEWGRLLRTIPLGQYLMSVPNEERATRREKYYHLIPPACSMVQPGEEGLDSDLVEFERVPMCYMGVKIHVWRRCR